jgi:hypothetical protein
MHPSFRKVLEAAGYEPSRVKMQEVYGRMGDRDGNFRQQFQTEGFDARVWELYLYAAFSDAGYVIDTDQAVPDFILSRGDLEWAVEATTANPRAGDPRRLPSEPSQLLAYLSDELPIRLGSPLFSKLTKDYPALPHVAGKPFVIALQCFTTEDSLFLSETTITTYLFGRRAIGERRADGTLAVRYEDVGEHRAGDKTIPSGFFRQPGTDTVSAVLFSNSGTVAKFGRMAFQEGVRGEVIAMHRRGSRYVHDPDADEPAAFSYEVGSRYEPWAEGLVFIHNPGACHPLPADALPGAAHYRLEDGFITMVAPSFHAFMSQTVTVTAGDGG